MDKEKKSVTLSKERIEEIYNFLKNSKIQNSDIETIKENESEYLKIIDETEFTNIVNGVFRHE